MQPKRLFIIDAMAMAFRSFYAFGMRPLTTSSGQPTSAVFGSAMFLNKLISEMTPDYLVVATDSQEPTFRHQLYPAYKANRSEMPEDLAAQLPDFFRLLDAFGCHVLKQPGFEADDLIGSLARRWASPDCHVYIVSGDKDFCQLVNDHVSLYVPKKGEEAVILDASGVREKFGVDPHQVIDTLAIIGDTSDNVPGVHGIGEKGAAKLINEYGSLDGVYAHLDRIANKKQKTALEECRDTAYLSRQLVTIHTDCKIDVHLSDFVCDPNAAVANTKLLQIYREMEFRGLTAKVESALKGTISNVANTDALPQKSGAADHQKDPKEETKSSRKKPKSSRDPSVAKDSDTAEDSAPLFASKDVSSHAPLTPLEGYHLVANRSSLEDMVAKIRLAKRFVFDTETTGLDAVSDTPIGMSFSIKHGEAYYVPLVDKHLDGIPSTEVKFILAPLLASDHLKIGHNVKFDVEMLKNAGIAVHGPLADTMIMDWLLEATGKSHGLDSCCLRHLGYEKIPTASLIGAKGEIPMLDVDLTALTRYACEDADYTLRLYDHLFPLLRERDLLPPLETVEMPLVPILASMEQTGIYVDTAALAKFSRRLATMAAELEEKIHKEAGGEFNINSPKQLADILFQRLKVHEQLGVRSLKKTKTGYSTDESVLQRLSAHPLPKALLEYRTVSKLKSTYVDALQRLVHPKTGRVHTSFHQTGTATGRLSSSDPNLQNIPIRGPLGREIRQAFRAKDPDWVIVSADYSQVELRILAHLAQEESLAQAFAEGADIHRATASRVFGVAPEEVDTDMRSKAKAINFGIIYGMGPKRLAAETGTTVEQAKEFIERYFASYPKINDFIEQSIQAARSKGYATTITGRRRPVTGLEDRNMGNVVNAENIAVNSPIQGSAADLIKLAMIRIQDQLSRSSLEGRLLLQVHDELVFECPKGEADTLAAVVRDCMKDAMRLTVPLEVEVGIGETWLEAH